MTTTFVFHHSLSLETWRRLALGAATLVVLLVATLTTILVVGTASGATSRGSQPGGDTQYNPACAPTVVVHPC